MSGIFKIQHANQRYYERVGTDISKKDIMKAVEQNQIQYFKRETQGRSQAYILLFTGEVVKALIVRKGKKKDVLTFLPWRDSYKEVYNLFHPQYGKFKCVIYPDCYKETNNRYALTKVFLGDETEQMQFNNYRYHELVDMTWDYHETKIKEETKE